MVAFDVDGILLNTAPITIDKFNELYDTSLKIEDWTTYKFERCFNYTTEMNINAFRKAIEETKDNPPFYPGAVKALKFFVKEYPDNPLTIVTGREKKWAMIAKGQIEQAVDTEIVLDYYDRTYREKQTDKNYISTGKLNALLGLGIKVFFEDDPRFWKHYINNEIIVYTFNRLYNQKDIRNILLSDDKRRWGLRVYDDWDQLVEYWKLFNRRGHAKTL
jgi:hypothetical protein